MTLTTVGLAIGVGLALVGLALVLAHLWTRYEMSGPVATPLPRRRYPRDRCQVCGKPFAVTSKGLWRHKCTARPGTIYQG